MASPSTSGRGEPAPDPFLALKSPDRNLKYPLTAKQFYVFINHRGPDVKTTLARQLYYSVKEAGIPAYLDSEETELGDSISSTIKNAIYSARVHIAILSPRYAESAWCLAELALMFQTKAIIIPLFYHVPPADFRHITNEVEAAFAQHERKGRYPNHHIQQWKDCLKSVAGIKGYEFKEQEDQVKLCKDVVSAVIKEKQKRLIPFQVAKHEVGLNELAKDFHRHCQRNGEIIDKTVGIYGMGGSGKTTLAKYLFNRKRSEFSASTFLFDVWGKAVKGELPSLQGQLLKDLFSLEGNTIPSKEHGISAIKENLERSRELRFLIVIDNVNAQEQLDALVDIDALNPNSLVIVTTRDERLLTKARIRVHYKMREMNREHSRLLFCWHAFNGQSCETGFDNLVDNFVDMCKGLPLALQVMGAHVSGGDKNYWKLQLEHFKVTQHKGIKDTLRISYDALEEDEKQIFMDVACFFIGEDVSTAIGIWKASGWRAKHALQTLKDKCLVETRLGYAPYISPHRISKQPYIFRMHDHLRDLGRDMADNGINHCRRLWRPEDLIGIREIKKLRDSLVRPEGESFRCYSSLYDSESNRLNRFFLETAGTSTELRWLDLQYKIPEWIPLQNLHTLNFEGQSPRSLWRRDNQVSHKLKELRFFFRPRLTNSTHDDRYHVSDKLKKLCCFLWPCLTDKSLRDLNELVRSFGNLKNLETLRLNFECGIFTWNIEWNCFLKSVRELTNLKTLELMYFQIDGEFALSNSGETTGDRFCMGSLQAIFLCGAFKTRRVSVSGHLCPALKSLKLYSMEELIEVDLTEVTSLECLEFLRCKELRKVLGNGLLQLEIFRVKYCSALTEFPNILCASYLKRIYISHCLNIQDISAIESLKGLKRIWIAYCPELKNIKAIEQLNGLKRIWINNCRQLQGTICLKELKALKSVYIGRCPRLQNIQGIEFLKCLKSIIINACTQLQQVAPGIETLGGLKEMIIADSPIIGCAERLQKLPFELTIMMGRTAMSDKIAEEDDSKLTSFMSDLIGDTLSMVNEIDCSRGGWLYGWEGVEEQVKETIQSFQRTQHSLSTFIFCAMVDGSPGIASDFCDGSTILRETILPIPSYHGSDYDYRQRKMYACVVNEARVSDYDSWMPSSHMWYACSAKKAFFMGVNKGEERKILQILQSLFAQPCVVNSEYYENDKENLVWLRKKVGNGEYHEDEENIEKEVTVARPRKKRVDYHRKGGTWRDYKVDWWREPFDDYNEESGYWRDYEVDWFDIEEYDGGDDNDS